MGTIVPLLAIALTLSLATAAAGAAGDYRLVQGTIAIWPQEPFAYGLALVQGDDGVPYFVQWSPVTSSPAGLRQGDAVSILGRETYPPSHLDAVSVERRGPAVTPGWRTLTGTVESMAGSTLILRVASGQRIAVDMSQMPADRRNLTTGQELTVVGLLQNPTLLTARGVATNGSSGAAAALPRQ